MNRARLSFVARATDQANQVEKDPGRSRVYGRSSRDRTKPIKMNNLEDGKMEIDVVSLHIRGYGR